MGWWETCRNGSVGGVAAGFEHPALGGRQKLTQGLQVVPARSTELHRKAEIETQHVAYGREAQMILDGLDDPPGLVLFERFRRILSVRAALSV